jgi:type I restriction enzyme, S subunit
VCCHVGDLGRATVFWLPKKPVSGKRDKGIRGEIESAGHNRHIVAEVEQRLSLAQESEVQFEASLKRSSRLRPSILKRAFEGKLVPQDPNDEPASLLLDRLLDRVSASRRGVPPRCETSKSSKKRSVAKSRKTEESKSL